MWALASRCVCVRAYGSRSIYTLVYSPLGYMEHKLINGLCAHTFSPGHVKTNDQSVTWLLTSCRLDGQTARKTALSRAKCDTYFRFRSCSASAIFHLEQYFINELENLSQNTNVCSRAPLQVHTEYTDGLFYYVNSSQIGCLMDFFTSERSKKLRKT